jgi:hypothetical protein
MGSPITTHEMIQELRREAALRERVFPAWVAKGTLKPEVAARRIAVVKAAAERLEGTMSFEETTSFGSRPEMGKQR